MKNSLHYEKNVTQNISDNFNNFNFTPEEGLESLLTLFNLIPDPAIIYQPSNDSILAANNALFLLTNLGEADFIHQSIKTLLPNISNTDPLSGHDKKAFLRHKKLPLMPVTVRIFPLVHVDEYLIILLKPDDERPVKISGR